MSQQIIHIRDLTQAQAKQWLIENDPEAADYWAGLSDDTNFRACVIDNLKDFGDDEESQSGEFIVQHYHLRVVSSSFEDGVYEAKVCLN